MFVLCLTKQNGSVEPLEGEVDVPIVCPLTLNEAGIPKRPFVMIVPCGCVVSETAYNEFYQRPRPQRSMKKKNPVVKSKSRKSESVETLLNSRRDQRIAEKGKMARPEEPVVVNPNERTSLLWTPYGAMRDMSICVNDDTDSSSTESER